MNGSWKVLAAAVLFFGIAPVDSFADLNMQEGNWETSIGPTS